MQINLITDISTYRASHFPMAKLVEWTGNNNVVVTAEEFDSKISQYINVLARSGIGHGVRVATYCQSTRIDMMAAEFAVMRLGGIVCPLHWTSVSEDLGSTLHNIQPQFCIINNAGLRNPIETAISGLTDVTIIQSDALQNNVDAKADPNSNKGIGPSQISAQNPTLIISTSGTSGKSKGVVLTHENVVATVLGAAAVVPINSKHTLLSFLPISHILERTAFYSSLLLGAEIHFSDSPRHAYILLNRIKPHYFTGVPRNLERTFIRFQQASNARGFFTRQIFSWSLRQGKTSSRLAQTIAKWFVMNKLRKIFGRRIKGIIVGGAAMNGDIIQWFDMAGIKVREGYGLSETSGAITINRFTPGECKFGSAGRPLPGVEIKIAVVEDNKEGQILVRCPSLMQGYIQNGQFEKIRTQDGWFETGDTGSLDESGFLTITGRLKDNFKNSFGQYVSPIRIEKQLELEVGIDRVMVIGFQRPYTSAIIHPDFEFIQTWANSKNVHWTAPEYMVHNPEIIQYYQAKIDKVNKHSQVHERILGFALVSDEWTSESGMLTPTLKLKRDAIIEKYRKVVEGVYN